MGQKKDDGLSGGSIAAIAFVMFMAAVGAAGLYFKFTHVDPEPVALDPEVERLSAAIKSHPDPEVAQDFGQVGAKAVAIVIQDLDREDGLFTVYAGRPLLAIRRSVVNDAKTAEGMEKLWGILSHEHAHYLAWRDTGFHPLGETYRRLTESQCTWFITTEIDAYAKGCRDARKYGWDSVMYQCGLISLKTVAEQKLRDMASERGECAGIWNLFAGRDDVQPASAAAASPATRPHEPPTRSGHEPIYLAPP